MIKTYGSLPLWIIAFLAISYGLGQVTQGGMQDWYQNLEKSSLTPANIAFPIVWSILYVMIAVAGWNLWRVGASRTLKVMFVAYMLMNWAWTPIFFGAHQILWSFIWIVALTILNLACILKAWRPVRLSAALMVPLFLWTSFASYLSYQIWVLNA